MRLVYFYSIKITDQSTSESRSERERQCVTLRDTRAGVRKIIRVEKGRKITISLNYSKSCGKRARQCSHAGVSSYSEREKIIFKVRNKIHKLVASTQIDKIRNPSLWGNLGESSTRLECPSE